MRVPIDRVAQSFHLVRHAPESGRGWHACIEDALLSEQRAATLDDSQMVLWSAEILQKTEFEVFEQAYHAWYQETPETVRLERIFAAYMFDGVVPFWVRQFTRTTVECAEIDFAREHGEAHRYLIDGLRAASGTLRCTALLALTLFLPYLVFPWSDAEIGALPA